MKLKKSAWTITLADGGRLDVSATWHGAMTGAPVFVKVRRQGTYGEIVERRGTMTVQRTLRGNGGRFGNSLIEPIVSVEVKSLNGDVVGKARTVRGAAEEYASKVAQIVADQAGKVKV